MKLTREDAIRLHREMWDLLAQNPALSKEGALDLLNCGSGALVNDCFLCEYDDFAGKDSGRKGCHYCPLLWPSSTCMVGGGTGLYSRWRDSDSISEKMRLAAQIRDLPEKPIPAQEEPKPVLFDGLMIEDMGKAFGVTATLNGLPISCPYICSIMKDGSGLKLEGYVSNAFEKEDNCIKLLN